MLKVYADRVNVEFVKAMKKMFGDKFHAAPVKKTTRMRTKVKADLEADYADDEAQVKASLPVLRNQCWLCWALLGSWWPA